MSSVYDFEAGASVPADVRRAIAAARQVLRAVGPVPLGPDGGPQVIIAVALPGSVQLQLQTFARALEELEDPAVHSALRTAVEQARSAALAVVLCAVGPGGDFWCAALAMSTGSPERADA